MAKHAGTGQAIIRLTLVVGASFPEVEDGGFRTLTSQSARLLLARDPARVPGQLDRLEEMTGSTLAQLRPPQSA